MDPLSRIIQNRVVDGDNTNGKLSGATFVAFNKNDVICSAAAGRIGLDASSKPAEPDTVAWVASLTKIVTTTCIMQQVEKGIIAMDADMRDVLPELAQLPLIKGFDGDEMPILEANNAPITMHSLLTHTAGLGYDNNDPILVRWAAATDRKVRHISLSKEGYTTPLIFTPGQGWVYGSALDWAGMCFVKILGVPLSEYMQEHIFDVAEMADTGFYPDKLPHTASRTFAITVRLPDGSLKEIPSPIPRNPEVESGGAGLYTSAVDFSKFLRGLLQGTFLKEATLREMFTPQLNEVQRVMLQELADQPATHDLYIPGLPDKTQVTVGIGGLLNLNDVPGKRAKLTLGWGGALNSRWWLDLETGIGGVLMVSCLPWGEPNAAKLLDELERAVYETVHSG